MHNESEMLSITDRMAAREFDAQVEARFSEILRVRLVSLVIPIIRNILKGRDGVRLQLATLAICMLPALCLVLALSQSIWKPLPFREADTLIVGPDSGALAEALAQEVSTNGAPSSVSKIGLFSVGDGHLVMGDLTERVQFAVVSPQFLETLGLQALSGNLSLPESGLDPLGRPILLSERFRKKGVAIASLGTLNGLTGRIYGFVANGAMFPRGVDAWIVREKREDAAFRGAIRYEALFRLNHDSSISSLSQLLTSARLHHGFSKPTGGPPRLFRIRDYLYQDQEHTIQLAMWITLSLFLIGIVNSVAAYCYELFQAQRELVLKLALGCPPLSLAVELLIRQEIYATCGWIIAATLAPIFTSNIGDFLGLKGGEWNTLSPAALPALGGSLVAVWLSAMAVAGAQMWILRRIETGNILQDSSHSLATSRVGQAVQNTVMFCQIVLMTALLSGGVYAYRGYWLLANTELGFRTKNILVIETDGEAVPPESRWLQLRALMQSLEGPLPIQKIGAINYLPLDPRQTILFGVKPLDTQGDQMVPAGFRVIDGDYFGAIGLPLLEGRSFSPQLDHERSPCRVIVNRLLSGRLYVGSPLGRRLVMVGSQDQCEIVGVVADIRHRGPMEPPIPEMYHPMARTPWATMTIVASVSTPPEALFDNARRVSLGACKGMNVVSPTSLDRVLDARMRGNRTQVMIIAVVGGLAFGLTLLGLYALVARRMISSSKRIALEVALGASQTRVLSNVFGLVALVVCLGSLVGASLGIGFAKTILAKSATILDSLVVTAGLVAALVAIVSMTAAYSAVRSVLRREPADLLRCSR